MLSPHNNIVGYGRLELTPNEIAIYKKGIAVSTIESVYVLPKLRELNLFEKGFLVDQSFPSILVSHILAPNENEKILDMCAAPGGKTTHLAQLMNNKGIILACDRSPKRLQTVENNLIRLGIKNVKTLKIDSRELPLKYNLKFDKILIDPPCTAFGHRPKLYDTVEFEKTISVSQYQKQLIRSASKLLKEGGSLVYSTCTIPYYENELVIKYACEELGFKIKEQEYHNGSKGESISPIEDLNLCQRFYPDKQDTPGFFIAQLQFKKN